MVVSLVIVGARVVPERIEAEEDIVGSLFCLAAAIVVLRSSHPCTVSCRVGGIIE
jgi:hypothetical protein